MSAPGSSMTAHLEAMGARLTGAASHPADLFAPALDRRLPFFVVEAPSWDADPDAPLASCGPAWSGPFQTDVRVRAVAATPTTVDAMLRAARRALPGRLTVADRVAEVGFERAEVIFVDDRATDPATNRHPAVGVDTYTLTSQPTT